MDIEGARRHIAEAVKRTDGTVRPSKAVAFLRVAETLAELSTCPEGARHGAVITVDDRIVATGYGSPAAGAPPCERCWLREKFAATGVKDWTVCPSVHAEANAVATAARNGISVRGGTIYITRSPCTPCESLLVNAGVAQMVFRGAGRLDRVRLAR
jgi:dCMP deaminase